MLDCVIIGAGAAGVSAALTAKLLKLNFVLLGEGVSLKIGSAERVKNYPGLPSVTGERLRAALSDQLTSEGIEIVKDRVNGVYPAEDGYTVACAQNAYKTRAVILATGVETAKPVAGERELLGKGVSYCAACDGFLYRGKKIAAAVESEEELKEVDLLKRYASEVVLLHLGSPVAGSTGRLTSVCGKERVQAVEVEGKPVPVDGVFILKRAVAAESLVHGIAVSGGSVLVDRACRTNLPGVFAAGDVTGRPYQYAKAVGEGNVAAHSVFEYLRKV